MDTVVYSLKAPTATHRRQVNCADGGCQSYTYGWRMRIDEKTDLGRDQAIYIRVSSGRSFTEERDETGLTVFTFEPGQRDFKPEEDHYHSVRLEREPFYLVRGGGSVLQHTTGEDWVDDMETNLDGIRKIAERG